MENIREQKQLFANVLYLFHDGGRYHIEASLLICSTNQWTGFYMVTASVTKVKISQYSQENTYGGVSFLKKKTRVLLNIGSEVWRRSLYLEWCDMLLLLRNVFQRKGVSRLQHNCFPVNISKFKNTYFEEHLRTAAS